MITHNVYSDLCPEDSSKPGRYGCMSIWSIVLLPTMITYSPFITTEAVEDKAAKPIKNAKSDAIAYIAIDGENYHTAALEQAFNILRKQHPKATNMELAKMVVNY